MSFELQQGKPMEYRTDTGAVRNFCDACGTSLTYEINSRPDEIDITTAVLIAWKSFRRRRMFLPKKNCPGSNW